MKMEVLYRRTVAGSAIFAVLTLNIVSLTSATVDTDEGQCSPEHVHLSMGSEPTQMVVMWATNGTCDTELLYGTSPWQLDKEAKGTSATLTDSNKDGLHVIHRVLLTGLQPNTTFFYRASSNKIIGTPSFFKTPVEDTDYPHEFLVVGDMGQHWELQPTLLNQAQTGKYTLMLHLGGFTADFSADNGTMGDKFMRLMGPIAAVLPCMTSPGEHESDNGQFTNYRYRFSMPGPTWPMPRDRVWYSFNLGLAHFVSYSTEIYLGSDEALKKQQYNWLVQDLNKANEERDKRPWIIAFGHRPMYCSGRVAKESDCGKDDSRVRKGLEDLFFHYGVDLILQSHEQLYERLYPVFKRVVLATNYTNPRAPLQITAGSPVEPPPEPTTTTAAPVKLNTTAAPAPEKPTATGESASASSNNSSTSSSSSRSDSSPRPAGPRRKRQTSSESADFSAFRLDNETRPGYGVLRVINATHVQWEFRSGPSDGDLIDSVILVQEKHGRFELSDLPPDVSKEIDEHLVSQHGDQDGVAGGGKPGVLNVADPARDEKEMINADNMRRIIIGASFGGFVALVLLVLIIMRLRRKGRRRVARRWDSMDYKYGKTKLYAPGNDDDFDDKEDDNDFEVDIPDGSMQTTKLINGK